MRHDEEMREESESGISAMMDGTALPPVRSEPLFCPSEIEAWAKSVERMEGEETVSELVNHGAYGIVAYTEDRQWGTAGRAPSAGAPPDGFQLVSEAAIAWLHDNHPGVYAGFYERVDRQNR